MATSTRTNLNHIKPKDHQLFQQLGKAIADQDFDPIYQYKKIPQKLPYESTRIYLAKPNCHLGQRKLLLNELQFYSCYLPKQPYLIIYAGSASNEHMPIVLKHFPNSKFLLIDPNYHNIDLPEVRYIYQNTDNVSTDNLREFTNYIRYRGNDQRMLHLQKGARRLNNIKFINDQSYDVIDSVSDPQSKDHQIMKQIKDSFFNTNYKSTVTDIMNSSNRVFIIQDYMTQTLSEKIRASLDHYKKSFPKLSTFFVTDIRTTFSEQGVPGDLDILWNSCLQIIFLQILKPNMSMLKFHPPYFNPNDKHNINTIWNQTPTHPLKKLMKDDFDWVKKQTGIDYIKDYQSGIFEYFKPHDIFLQPWAPNASSESRLIVAQKDLRSKFVPYDHKEWENKFFYLNLSRAHAYHSKMIQPFISHHLDFDYDGCFDCALEIIILAHMLNGGGPTIDFKKLAKKMKSSKSFCQQILQVSQHINRITFYNVRQNRKCPMHHVIFSKPKQLYFYRYVNLFSLPDRDNFNLQIDIITVNHTGTVKVADTVSAQVERQSYSQKLKLISIPQTDLNCYPRIRGSFENMISTITNHKLLPSKK